MVFRIETTEYLAAPCILMDSRRLCVAVSRNYQIRQGVSPLDKVTLTIIFTAHKKNQTVIGFFIRVSRIPYYIFLTKITYDFKKHFA